MLRQLLHPHPVQGRIQTLVSVVLLGILVLAFPPAKGLNAPLWTTPVLVLGWIVARGASLALRGLRGELAAPAPLGFRHRAVLSGFSTLTWMFVACIWIFVVLPYPVHTLVELAPRPEISHRTKTYSSDKNCRISANNLGDLIPTYAGRASETVGYVQVKANEPSVLAPCTLIGVAPGPGVAAAAPFTLSVLQFNEQGRPVGGGCTVAALRTCTDRQMEPLLQELLDNDGNVVVAYVHGWRHDSRDRSSDIGRLATLANYSASFVRQRQDNKADSRPLRVTAIYIGWRGSLLDSDNGSLWSTLKAAFTFASRKNASERASAAVVAALDTVAAALRASDNQHGRTGATRSRMLVVGHSAGGNLLLEGLRGRMARDVDSRVRAKAGWEIPMAAPLGDLVVLLNPASEASKWIEVQRSFFSAVNSERGTSPSRLSEVPQPTEVNVVFPSTQPPSVIAITAGSFRLTPVEIASRLQASPSQGARQAEDTITRLVFKLNQMVSFGQWLSPEGRNSLGHYLSSPLFNADFRVVAPFLGMPPESGLGVTHSLEGNGHAGIRTHFNNAASSAPCTWRDSNWLWYMRRVEAAIPLAQFNHRKNELHAFPNGPALPGWDGNSLSRNVKSFGVIRTANSENTTGSTFISMQYRHRPDRGGRPSAVPAAFPYWNVRATDSAIANHGDFVSYPLWCSIHQLLLDDPASAPIAP